ncbi:ORC4 [Candida jiufengensis]|uniref:ORC4 n=1 Tax=Candida jiufengensis TaxID=497108 RepID=UPI002225B28E|nr:ORC4 [Candida jiufengensis]KAI5956299.1 ORC4 [Candida jiufengensis]
MTHRIDKKLDKYKKIQHIKINNVRSSLVDEFDNNMEQDSSEICILDSDIRKIKNQVLSQLNCNFGAVKISNLNNCYNILHNLLEKSVRDKERHSLLITGTRSSGKSSIVRTVLREINNKYPDEFLVIQLNSATHSDDNLALREIARQLDYKLFKRNKTDSSNSFIESKSINETFANILKILNNDLHQGEYDANWMPLIFVIDEFEKFTQNNKQTLLYNLLDMSQNSSIPVSLVGLTTNLNAKDYLEKRVSSRFSQRMLAIKPHTSYSNFYEDYILNLKLDEQFIKTLDSRDYGNKWNSSLDNLQCDEINRYSLRNYNTIKNFTDINNHFKKSVSKLSQKSPYLAGLKTNDMSDTELVQSSVMSLSEIELMLVIAAARWLSKFDGETVNFNLAYTEYKSCIKESGASASILSSFNNIKVHQKEVSKKALRNSWEVLLKSNVIVRPNFSQAGDNWDNRTARSTVLEENSMVLLNITLEELNILIDDDNMLKKFIKI